MSRIDRALGPTENRVIVTPWIHDVGQWARFLEAAGMSAVTIRSYRRAVVNFVADTLLDLDAVTEQDIVDYLVTFPARGHARGSIIRAFRSFGAWRERRRGLPDPAAALKLNRAKYGPAPALTDEELTRLIIAAAWRSERRAWAILLFYGTGVRLASACAVRPEDIHGSTLFIRVAKGNRPYSVPLGRVARAAVDGLLPTANGTLIGAGPGRVWQWIHEAGEDAGIRAHPHLLRHTFATRLLERGVDVRTLQELGNWADLSQIPRYTAVTDPRKRDAVDLL